MHNNIAKHNIKRLACLLAATLLLTSCITLVSAKTVKIRGAPGSIEAGSTMFLDGFNFPELIYRIGDDRSYEWLNISFAKNGTINEGDASYTTKLYKNSPKREIMFMGSKYNCTRIVQNERSCSWEASIIPLILIMPIHSQKY